VLKISGITPKLLRQWGACWSDARIADYFGRFDFLTPREASQDTAVDIRDRLWVLCQCISYLDAEAGRLFAVDSALLAVNRLDDDTDHKATLLGLLNQLCEIEDLPEGERDASRASAASASRAAAASALFASDAASDAAYYAVRAVRAAAYASYASYAPDASAAAFSAYYAAADAGLSKALDRALEWLGDYADGWWDHG
jgi:hypothetical protein